MRCRNGKSQPFLIVFLRFFSGAFLTGSGYQVEILVGTCPDERGIHGHSCIQGWCISAHGPLDIGMPRRYDRAVAKR